jgi:DNA-binding MarR family transcriptional regulator
MKLRTARPKIRAEQGADLPLHPEGAEEHLGYLLKRLMHTIRQAIDERMRVAGVGLSFAQFATLMVISHHPGISGARIAKTTMVTAQTINTILRRLESEGCLERKPHPDNRRVDCWYITEHGRAQMVHAKATAEPVWETMLAPLTADETAQLRGLLKRCIDGLERSRTAGGDAFCKVSSSPRASRPVRRAKAGISKDSQSRGKRA